ncbi:MAG TPA: response regulator [Chthoniobacteraceae bacterium]|nr:response regulator [Chthoniobacteraceae bacterium]
MAIISEPEPPQLTAAKPTLLIVDDEEGPRQSLRIVFKNDYKVLLASNGLEALELVRNNKIDVVVCDIMMFGMSGVEVLKEIKEIDPSVEVVMLTAFETIETARQALRLGASDYLNKPFDIPSMRSAVKRAAEKHLSAVEFRKTNEHLHELQQMLHDYRVREEVARAQGEIYASVLHDINSPLTVISGFVELINRSMENAARVEGEQLAKIKGDLNTLNGQVGRCFEISRRYLSFLSKNESEKVRVGANQAINDLRDLLVRHPSARGQQLNVAGLEQDVIADIHGTDFLQILLNLTINALQASDTPHRVDVACRLLPEPLDLAAFHDEPEQRFINRDGFANVAPLLAVTITDNGSGIAPNHLARMFEERFTTKPPDRGTGLGLSIVKRLIREARGAVQIQTRIGKGSTFTVCLQTLPSK